MVVHRLGHDGRLRSPVKARLELGLKLRIRVRVISAVWNHSY